MSLHDLMLREKLRPVEAELDRQKEKAAAFKVQRDELLATCIGLMSRLNAVGVGPRDLEIIEDANATIYRIRATR